MTLVTFTIKLQGDFKGSKKTPLILLTSVGDFSKIVLNDF